MFFPISLGKKSVPEKTRGVHTGKEARGNESWRKDLRAEASWQAEKRRSSLEKDSHISLFIDGIDQGVDYQQIKDLFAQYGKNVSVFVQRFRKPGRRFRFGF